MWRPSPQRAAVASSGGSGDALPYTLPGGALPGSGGLPDSVVAGLQGGGASSLPGTGPHPTTGGPFLPPLNAVEQSSSLPPRRLGLAMRRPCPRGTAAVLGGGSAGGPPSGALESPASSAAGVGSVPGANSSMVAAAVSNPGGSHMYIPVSGDGTAVPFGVPWTVAGILPSSTPWAGLASPAMGQDTAAAFGDSNRVHPGAMGWNAAAASAWAGAGGSSWSSIPPVGSGLPMYGAMTPACGQKTEDTDAAQPGQKRARGGRRVHKSTQPAPANTNDIVDLTDASVADWCDENVRIACEIFVEEVRIGNRSNTHLNKAGYKNVIKKFKERTNLTYTVIQFKNKWDKLKIEYGVWKQLTRQTDLGCDASGKNIDMPEEWWRMANAIKGSHKFQQKGPQNEELLAEMFDGLCNNGDDHWCPSSGVAPSQINIDSGAENEEDEDEADNDDDSEPEEVRPSSCNRKKGKRIEKSKEKKPRNGHWLSGPPLTRGPRVLPVPIPGSVVGTHITEMIQKSYSGIV